MRFQTFLLDVDMVARCLVERWKGLRRCSFDAAKYNLWLDIRPWLRAIFTPGRRAGEWACRDVSECEKTDYNSLSTPLEASVPWLEAWVSDSRPCRHGPKFQPTAFWLWKL